MPTRNNEPIIERIPIKWDAKLFARALDANLSEVHLMFQDGRVCAAILGPRIRKVVRNCYGPNPRYQVRIVTDHGIAFSPSWMRGHGRRFVEDPFVQHVQALDYFATFDATSFPVGYVKMIPAPSVLAWWRDGRIGEHATASRAQLLAAEEGCAVQKRMALKEFF